MLRLSLTNRIRQQDKDIFVDIPSNSEISIKVHFALPQINGVKSLENPKRNFKKSTFLLRDRPSLILWFKEEEGKPIFRFFDIIIITIIITMISTSSSSLSSSWYQLHQPHHHHHDINFIIIIVNGGLETDIRVLKYFFFRVHLSKESGLFLEYS